MADPSCSTCRFADVAMLDTAELGETPHAICRRFPPAMVGDAEGAGPVWPPVHEGDWCGEHRLRPELEPELPDLGPG